VAKRRPIRDKLLLGGLLVGFMVAILSASSFLGVSSYRRLVRSLSYRASELPRASDLNESVGLLRLAQVRWVAGSAEPGESFAEQLAWTRQALNRYREQLIETEFDDHPIGDRSLEKETAQEIDSCLRTIERIVAAPAAVVDHDGDTDTVSAAALQGRLTAAEPHLERLAALAVELPTFLQARLHDLSHEVRDGYRSLIMMTLVSSLAAAMLLAALGVLTYRWVFRPLRHLGQASRRVAAGDFAFRIHLDTRDEMAELADALNDMTKRFSEIRDDLDNQVQLRTREVIRSEQLASVGFLAAGVAHEINNPLASIAMCAESLESRLESLSPPADEAAVITRYLELIQNEAFRCKGITEKLLNFSRLGEVRRQATAVAVLVADVGEMLRHVGRFAGKTIDIVEGPDVLVMVNPQEIKQVVLNLLVNALDSIEDVGRVRVTVKQSGGEGVLTISDNGCGMSEEVLEHLFEPFFTRRKAGQGTGLGLSIVHRIVADHGGRIEASSAGEGQGSTFRVMLPLAEVAAGAGAGRDAVGRPAPSRDTTEETDHHSEAA
jgi:two-component system NtrC family sensor kinase